MGPWQSCCGPSQCGLLRCRDTVLFATSRPPLMLSSTQLPETDTPGHGEVAAQAERETVLLPAPGPPGVRQSRARWLGGRRRRGACRKWVARVLLMVKTHLAFRLDSQAYKSLMPFFNYGRSQGLSIHRARGLLALNQALI
jgi:hypothetical protein